MIINAHYPLLFKTKIYSDTYTIDRWTAGSRMEISRLGSWITVYQNRADSGSNTVFYTQPLNIPKDSNVIGMLINCERNDKQGTTGTTYIVNDIDDSMTEDPIRIIIDPSGSTSGVGKIRCLENIELDEDYFRWNNGQPLEIELEPLLNKVTIEIRLTITIIYSKMVYENYMNHYRLCSWSNGYYSNLRMTFADLFADNHSTTKSGVQLMYAGRDVPENCGLFYDAWNVPNGKIITSCKVIIDGYICSKSTTVQIPFLNDKIITLPSASSTSQGQLEYNATAEELAYLNSHMSTFKQPSIVINNNSSPATFAIHDSYIDITYA